MGRPAPRQARWRALLRFAAAFQVTRPGRHRGRFAAPKRPLRGRSRALCMRRAVPVAAGRSGSRFALEGQNSAARVRSRHATAPKRSGGERVSALDGDGEALRSGQSDRPVSVRLHRDDALRGGALSPKRDAARAVRGAPVSPDVSSPLALEDAERAIDGSRVAPGGSAELLFVHRSIVEQG